MSVVGIPYALPGALSTNTLAGGVLREPDRIQSFPCGLAAKKNKGSSYMKCLETNNGIGIATMLSIL